MPSTHAPPPAAERPVDQHADRIRALLAGIATAAHIPSISLAVADPTRVLFEGAIGYADIAEGRRATARDRYPWFSMTKIATATAAVRLHADGLLDLDAPVGSYLPGYTARADRAGHGHPSTRQLLSHTAGLRNPLPVRWVRPADSPVDRHALAAISDRHGTPTRPVGVRAAYSNIGYLLAAEVIETVTGRSIEDCIHGLVLAPLGMTSTGFRHVPSASRAVGYARVPRALRPALRSFFPKGVVGPRTGPYTSFHPFLVNGAGYGGLIGTASDAVRLAAMHAADSGDPHPVLSQQDVEVMRAVTSTGKPFDHGVGWFRKPGDASRAPSFVEHYGTGGGYWNAMRIYPGSRLAIVAMANTTAKWDVDRLFTEIERLPWR